ncbi:MAG: SCO family protein [Burkholderiales bacterium]|nr:SCO family protein [Burkholderiales bacterium]
MRGLLRFGLIALMALILTACGGKDKPAFQSTDVTDAPMGGDFRLTDHTGQSKSLADYHGKVVVVFFGYTHCPDACPTTMAELAGAMKQLGDKANQVQVLFISVDPERDSKELLAQYVPAFDARFVGMTGTPDQVHAVADKFKVVYQKVPASSGDPKNYTVDHSAGSYIFDKTGKLRLFVNYGAGASVFAHDIGLLLAS